MRAFFKTIKGWNLSVHITVLFEAVLQDAADSFHVCCYYSERCWNFASETAFRVSI